MPDNSTALSPNNKEDAITYFAACGKSATEIAELTNNSVPYIKKMMDEERFQFGVKVLRHKLFGKEAINTQKRFKDLLPQAMDVLQEVVENPNINVKLRFAASQEIFDRSLGKPKQTVQHEGSILQDIFEKLEKRKSPNKIIDIGPDDNNPNGVYPIEEAQEVERDSIDKWINAELK